MQQKKQLNGLTGLRFFAAFLVLLQHTGANLDSLGLSSKILNSFIFKSGTEGVYLFFILSGYLMGELYLGSEKSNSNFDPRSFIKKRANRILPLYFVGVFGAYLFLFFSGITSNSLHNFKNALSYFPCYLIGLPNIVIGINDLYIGSLTSLWSIGVELQFYLFFLMFVAFLYNYERYTWRLNLVIAIILYIVFYLIRFESIGSKYYEFISTLRFDLLFIGVMASLSFKKVNRFLFNFFTNKVLLVLSFISFIFFLSLSSTVYREIGIIISFVLILFQLGLNPAQTFLDHPTIHYLGEISYGIYIFHPLVSYPLRYIIQLFFGNKLPFNEEAFTFIYIMILFGITIIIAHLSYKYFESIFSGEKSKIVN